ncbi:Protein trapped in endoderm-1, partial [Gryllus bimaculatus]
MWSAREQIRPARLLELESNDESTAAAQIIELERTKLVGNAATALALLRCGRLRRHATTAFVLGLCASDLLFCAVNLPLTAARYAQRAWRLGDALCSLFAFFFYGNVAASLLSMVAITLTRLVLVACRAQYERVFRAPRAALLAAAAWLLGFAPMLLPLAGVWGRLGLHARTFSCTVLPRAGGGPSPKKLLFVVAFLLPCAVIVASYSCIYWRVRSSRRALRAHRAPSVPASTNGCAPRPVTGSAPAPASAPAAAATPAQLQQRREDSRLTRLMLSIFCCFLLCFLPLMLVNVADDEVRGKAAQPHNIALCPRTCAEQLGKACQL